MEEYGRSQRLEAFSTDFQELSHYRNEVYDKDRRMLRLYQWISGIGIMTFIYVMIRLLSQDLFNFFY
jgi:hypothetical protein